nr:MAG TPA: hypothetical protein [Caudoviricetes sp.]
MFKIIAAAAFVNDLGVSIHVGDETTISAELLDEHDKLCEEYGLQKHTVLEEIAEIDEDGKEKPKRGRKSKAEQTTEGGGQTTEGGGQTTEGGGQTTEGGGQTTEGGEL